MKHQSLRVRLLIFIIIAVLTPLLPVSYVYNEYENKLDDADGVRQQSVLRLFLAQNTIHSFHQQSIAWGNFLLRGHKPELYNAHLREVYTLERQTHAQTESLSNLLNQDPKYSVDISPILSKIENLRENYRKALDIYNLSNDPYFDTDHFIAPFTADILHDLQQLITRIQILEKEKLSALHDEIDLQKELFLLIILASVLTTITAFLWFFDINVGKPITAAIRTAKHIANGDIHSRIKKESTREFAIFSEAFNHMIDKLEQSNQQLEIKINELEVAQKKIIEASQTIIELTHQETVTANQARSQFLSHMSHELRTPLNAIIGIAQILNKGKLTTKQKNSLNEIFTAGEYLLKLINDVLDLSKIEKGTFDLSIETFNIEALTNESLSLIRPTAENSGIQINVDNQSFSRFHTKGDLRRCKEILLCLLSNAIKNARGNGKAWVSCTRNQDMLEISICDNGPQIPQEAQYRMFETFNHLGENNSYTQGQGTGIGLVICKRLADAMGGSLRFEIRPDNTNCFSFSLPLAITSKHPLF